MLRKLAITSLLLLVVTIASLACAQAPSPTPTSVPTKVPEAPKPVATATTAPAAPKPTAVPEPTKPAPSPTVAAAKPTAVPATVRLGSLGNLTDAPMMIANAKGYFKAAGLDVQTTRFDSAVQMIPPLGTGQLDIGAGAVSVGLYNAILRGVDIKIVADKSSLIPGRSALDFVVRKDLAARVKDFADLKGLSIAITGMGTSSEVQLYEALNKGKLKLADVKVINMPFPERMVAFSNKALDSAISIEPYTTQAVERDLIVRWKPMDQIYPNQQVSAVLYAPNFVKANPEAAKAFMVAYVRGLREYLDAFTKNKNKAEIIALLSKETDVKDAALYDKMSVFGIDGDGYVHVQSLWYDQDYFISTGQLQSKLDFAKVVDNQYVDNAVQILGKYQ